MTFSRRLAQHESLELIVVDPAGSVLVDFSDHLVQVSIRQILRGDKKGDVYFNNYHKTGKMG